MNRGIVMEISKRHLVVLTAEGSFYRLPVKPDASIGDEIMFPENARRSGSRRLYRLSALAVVIMLLLIVPFLLMPFKEHSAVAAYLTMDINPSLELGINKSEHVIQLRALNKAGVDLITDLSFQNLPLEQVTQSIMERVQDRNYLSADGGEIVITSIMMRQVDDASYENLLSQQMDAAIQKVLAETADVSAANHVEVTTLSAPKEVRDEANEQGISAGKMAVYLLAKSQGHEVSVEELKTHSIPQATKEWGGVRAVVDDAEKAEPDQQKKQAQLKKQLQELMKAEKDAQAKSKKTAAADQPNAGKGQVKQSDSKQKDNISSKDKDKKQLDGKQQQQVKETNKNEDLNKNKEKIKKKVVDQNKEKNKDKETITDKYKENNNYKGKDKDKKKQDKNKEGYNNNRNTGSRHQEKNNNGNKNANYAKDKDKSKDNKKDNNKDKKKGHGDKNQNKSQKSNKNKKDNHNKHKHSKDGKWEAKKKRGQGSVKTLPKAVILL